MNESRADRSHRLIQIGALTCKYFEVASPEDVEYILKLIVEYPATKKILEVIKSQKK